MKREPSRLHFEEKRRAPPFSGCAWITLAGVALVFGLVAHALVASSSSADCPPASWSWHIDGGDIAAEGAAASAVCRAPACRVTVTACGQTATLRIQQEK